MKKTIITVSAVIEADKAIVWEKWTNPADILQWNKASDDWHTTKAENDVRTGGTFSSRMEAKDGSFGFDFTGTYSTVIPQELLEYSIADGRIVSISFKTVGTSTEVTETFEAENTHPAEMQQAGWQNIMNNFKQWVERKAQ